jgi:SAM-dependent methyltransferase
MPEQEQQRYALHHNSPDDRRYHDYLSSIADDVLRFAGGPCAVLDFGGGKDAVLAAIMRARGMDAAAHDPLYGLVAAESRQFDIVVACEVLEHLRDPRRDMEFIARHVKPHGFVYARTRLYDGADFSSWWYAKDPTHICFFCGKTMEKVAEILGKEIIETNAKDTVVFGPSAP